ncbi:hypothetical protein H112_04462 [Trichophyton rubrum D6]|uniref:Hydrophobin n=4 Tax=Trichophyton TaxID=5550 RepID=A0A080WL16_TRIRC|nr:uncharacterized protein TERG_04234 [Trichophyton rubrum CBS 118892]EZF22989.1 hypothetical protein H100_04471 [Trichophyton rubrum MR850]EZF41814.1 hypothetical protein H102_04454 [Trichophyton rubrum CBS 100081]EZF73674.1 hypothetical protein H105_04479 [Trichophyton soudanense CBS 452.61]EZF84397.1 hypothetical protein H110_04457 [Trichophyton rubrum MR1448]EZF95190.1 hypothetical protein H113_04498 [Trichophyton rubrum MR1459]EZG06095.1 hypothetical protein H106_04280 [Trichophyton rubr
MYSLDPPILIQAIPHSRVNEMGGGICNPTPMWQRRYLPLRLSSIVAQYCLPVTPFFSPKVTVKPLQNVYIRSLKSAHPSTFFSPSASLSSISQQLPKQPQSPTIDFFFFKRNPLPKNQSVKMKFSIAAAVLALATAVVAHPGAGYVSTPEKEANFQQNFQKFVTACGNGNQVSCCNTETKKVGAPLTAGGLIPILDNLNLDDFSLLKGCSKVDVAAVIGVQDLLNSNCKTQVSCCKVGDTNQVGLVNANVDLKCAAQNIL